VAENGWLLLAPATKEVLPGEGKEPPLPLLWASVVDLKGTLFAAGGVGGDVYRIDRKGKTDDFFDGDALGVRALAADVAGNVFVATFPTGRVYRVDEDGKTEVYFEPEERYLWAMATDAFDRLYVATGERGIVYQVTGRGQGRPFFDSDDPHITALASDPSGRLIAGSSGRGLLYRLDNDGRGEVILDSHLEEISSVAVASDGTIYAAAISAPALPRPRRLGDRSDDLTIEVSPAGDDDLLEEASAPKKVIIDLSDLLPSAPESAPAASIVYKVLPGRTPVVLWSSATERAYSLALDARGHLLMGTGPMGRLYRVEPDGSTTMVRRFAASQITGLAAAPEGRTYVLTSNPGRAHALDGAPAPSGRFLSPVRDAGAVATWGTARWESDTPQGTKIDLSARSGNSPVPDATWSSWSNAYADPHGSPIQLPAARYIQWRADLSRLKTEATPVLKSVTVTYLPENLAPVVRNVVVGAQGAPKPQPSATAGGSRTPPDISKEISAPARETPARTRTFWVSWTATDGNNDTLRHSISLRRGDETEWRTIARGVKEAPFEIDPANVPEGRYVVRVEAGDEESNGEDRMLSGEARSEPFDIDKTPPRLEAARAEESQGMASFTLTARDATSPIESAEWSAIEDGPWKVLTPKDGICDTAVESFVIRLSSEDAKRRIFVRATDIAGNSATLEVTAIRPR
jgi:sugar lactone lactonase YvrE